MDFGNLTPEEQRSSIGMWCDTPTVTGIIVDVRSTTRGRMVQIYRPDVGSTAHFLRPELITVRDDLRRAWGEDKAAISA